MERRLTVEQLSVGMFVSGLDRPWLDTPFLLQGFLIEDEGTLTQLRQICEHVTVDFARSTIEEAARPPRGEAQSRSKGAPDIVVHVVRDPAASSAMRSDKRPASRPYDASKTGRQVRTSQGERSKAAAPRGDVESRWRNAQSPSWNAARVARPPTVEPGPRAASESARSQSGPGHRFGLLGWLQASLGRRRSDKVVGTEAPGDTLAAAGPGGAGRSALQLRIYQAATPIEQELGVANESYARARDVFSNVVRAIGLGDGLEIEAVEDVVQDLVESVIRNPDALQLVAQLQDADQSAYAHAIQVAVLLVSFGREVGFSREELAHLGQVGMLLDIGKLRIARSILDKRGNLTPEEFEEIKRHVNYGVEAVASSAIAHLEVVAGIEQHHERADGKGYPRGLPESEICPFGQMAGIVDTFCALTSNRPYADPVPPYEAMRLLQGWSGTSFNAGLVEHFVQAIGIFPVGTLVELSTGEVAVVIEQNRMRRLKPKVLIVSAPDRTPLGVPVVIDLLYAPSDAAGQSLYIRRGVARDATTVNLQDYYLSRV